MINLIIYEKNIKNKMHWSMIHAEYNGTIVAEKKTIHHHI